MHDGRVTAVAMAYDDSCFISAASDGTLLLLTNPLAAEACTSAAELTDIKLPLVSEDAAGQPEAQDIDAASLTLEEAKKAAQRSMQEAAEAAAREQLVAAVKAMREEYAAVVAANSSCRSGERVPQHMLELDTGGSYNGMYCST